MPKSVKAMLKTALIPLGKVMYIYGGGWNGADTGAGEECLTCGLSPKWQSFANSQGADYSFKDYDYKKDKSVIHLGLDCSGYVGWVLYNTLRDNRGYVFKSSAAAETLSQMGLGEYEPMEKVTERKAGDIMCSPRGHVYICVGECEDKSLILLHSSPPGVQLSATCTPEGEVCSLALKTAEKYMKTYYPRWFSRFPHIERDITYLTQYHRLKNTFLTDKEGLRTMSGERVLEEIFKT